MLNFLIQNWEVIGLLITNIGALFVKQPKQWGMPKDNLEDPHVTITKPSRSKKL